MGKMASDSEFRKPSEPYCDSDTVVTQKNWHEIVFENVVKVCPQTLTVIGSIDQQ